MSEIVRLRDYPQYGITSDGRVFSYKSNIFMKTPRMTIGYTEVNFHVKGKSLVKLVHRLVAETFIPNPLGKREVNHINGDKTDNRVENLEWVSPKENINHAFETGLNKCNMRVIAEDDHGHEVYRFRSQSEARQYGFDQRLISRAIKHGYRHKGLYWREVVLYEDNS